MSRLLYNQIPLFIAILVAVIAIRCDEEWIVGGEIKRYEEV